MKVLFVASEAAPLVKTGGLGEVIGSLPIELTKKGIDVRIIMPKYSQISTEYVREFEHMDKFTVKLGWRELYCGIDRCEVNGITFYFVDNQFYFARNYLYGYGDHEIERYAFFCRAVLDSLPYLDFAPDIIHCHDWQTALVPFLLKTQYKGEMYDGIKVVTTIHNLKYQGIFEKRVLNDILGTIDNFVTSDKLEFHGNINVLKAGIVYSDFINTVSPSYAEEIKFPFFGEGLDGLLRARGSELFGILNGVDYKVYDPQNDPYIFGKYDSSDWKIGKSENKQKLQELLGLEVRSDIPIIAIISRFVPQKGLDLIACVLDEIFSLDIQFIVMGSGDKSYEGMFDYASKRFIGKVASFIGYDDVLAHRIYAGADLFLMPSAFEPCGLGQLFSLRYGTIPIVRETGGLKDTVTPYNEYTMEGNGFGFSNYNAHDMLFTIKRALSFYTQEKHWDKIVESAMKCDYSWEKSADKYIEMYDRLIEK